MDTTTVIADKSYEGQNDLGFSTNSTSDLAEEMKGTHEDVLDMYRMGKTQQLRRNFKLVKTFLLDHFVANCLHRSPCSASVW